MVSANSPLAPLQFMSTKLNAWDDDEIPHNYDRLASKGPKPSQEKVRDEWDEDDDDEKEMEEAANGSQHNIEETHEAQPKEPNASTILKPQVVSPFNGGSAGSSFPPELSFEPPVRILRRPKPAGQLSSNAKSAGNERQTLQEREEKYRQARERIFGSPSPSASGPSTPKRVASPVEGRAGCLSSESREEPEIRRDMAATFSKPIREPLGPGTHAAFARKPITEGPQVLPSSKAA